MANTALQNTEMKIITADPGPIGLLGLAIVTLVASSQKLGWTEGLSVLIPWAIFLGATAQLIASLMDFKKNNVFGATAFGGYALFWYGMAMSWMIKIGIFGKAAADGFDAKQLAFVFLGYFIFTFYMTIGAMETTKVLFAIFFLIDFLFIGLTFSNFGIAEEFFHAMAGWSEFGIALLSFYGSGAGLLNNHFGYQFLPLGKPFGIFKK